MQSPDVVLGDLLQMIYGHGLQANIQLSSPTALELISVKLETEAVLLRGSTYTLGRLQREEMRFHKTIAKPGKLARCDEGNHLILDQIDVFLGTRFELDRDLMRSQERGNQLQWGDRRQLVNHLQEFCFVF